MTIEMRDAQPSISQAPQLGKHLLGEFAVVKLARRRP